MRLIVGFFFMIVSFSAAAQVATSQRDFLSFQKSFKRVGDAFTVHEDSLKKQFKEKGLTWPAKYMYLRSFKYDSQLEVWVKSSRTEKYKLFKSYRICALAGNLGPKRFEGDYQVPEGFYCLNEFKPNSNYNLALGVNYPNPSDRLLGDSIRPGGNIYIHGSCVTVGCIPITDLPIEELYVLAATVRNEGQNFIPLHVFPIKFNAASSKEKLDKYLETHPQYQSMVNSMMGVYYYFNQNRQLPIIFINGKGQYVMTQEFSIPKPMVVIKKKEENYEDRRTATKTNVFQDKDFYASVNNTPVFPGGVEAFQTFLQKLSADLTPYLPAYKKRIFVQVDFTIDKEGNLVNTKIGATANNEINNLILERFEALPKWKPALRIDQNVAIKLQQTIVVEARAATPEEPIKVKGEYEE